VVFLLTLPYSINSWLFNIREGKGAIFKIFHRVTYFVLYLNTKQSK